MIEKKTLIPSVIASLEMFYSAIVKALRVLGQYPLDVTAIWT